QGALLQDGGKHGRFVRIVRIDIASGSTEQFAYPLENLGTDEKPHYSGISDTLAINGHALLVLERDGKGRGDGSDAAFKRIYRVDLRGAKTLGKRQGQPALASVAMAKHLFADIVALAGERGMAPSSIPVKLEGLSFGPDIVRADERQHTLLVSSDNDFLAQLPNPGSTPVDNPNEIFVLSMTPKDLGGYIPQRMVRHCQRLSAAKP
ncbi:MAG: esterase-like activity of phytase family protein, partial [Rhodanobacter sp.]